MRDVIFGQLPKRRDLAGISQPLNIRHDIAGEIARAKSELTTMITAKDVSNILCRFPVRESPALDGVSKAHGFAGRAQYEEAVSVRDCLLAKSSCVAELARWRSRVEPMRQQWIAGASPTLAA